MQIQTFFFSSEAKDVFLSSIERGSSNTSDCKSGSLNEEAQRAADLPPSHRSNGRGAGIDNLLYSADAEFSCFADLALTSPGEYYKPGEGSLIQAVFDSRAFARSKSARMMNTVAERSYKSYFNQIRIS